MSTYCNDSRLFQSAFAGLLAGCLWFSAGTTALAQEAQNNAGQDNDANPPTSAQPAHTDSEIQSKVRYALTHDPTLQGQHVSCATADGIVILSGTVQTNQQFQQAETIASNVPGVIGIKNNIKVANSNSPEPPPPDQAEANTIEPNAAASQVPPPPPDEDANAQSAPNQPATGQPGPNQSSPNPSGENQVPQPYMGARPPYQPGYYSAPQQSYNTQNSTAPVTIPAGTLLRVRLNQTLDTAHLKSGTFFEGTVAADVYQNGVLAIPRGAVIQGEVVEAKKAGDLGGAAELRLQLTSVNLEGKAFPLTTDIWSSKGPNKAGYTVGNTAGGAALGAVIGGIIGGGAGAAIGAGVGGIGGLGVSSATSGPRLVLPVESQVDFHLTEPVTVQPVSWQEAQRLASSVPEEPRLVRRPYPAPMYAPYPYYPYPYYAYPYPYYYPR